MASLSIQRRLGADLSRSRSAFANGSGRSESPSPALPDREWPEGKRVVLGVCAMDAKARSKPMRAILTRIKARGQLEESGFGEKVILNEGIPRDLPLYRVECL